MFFTVITTLIMIALALMWRVTDPVNVYIKFFLLGMGLWGMVRIATGAF